MCAEFTTFAQILNKMEKNRIIILFSLLGLLLGFASCEEEDSYAERKEREREQINTFLKKGVKVSDQEVGDYLLEVAPNIKVISEETFYKNDSTTNVEANEYVLFKGSGVYMQILRKGTGEPLAEGQSATVIMRYTEFNIAADTIQSTNNQLLYETYPDVMTCSNAYGVFTGSFTDGLMKSLYNSPSVPSGWLIPMPFIRLGRQNAADAEIALVRLIVPSTQGQSDAMSNVYPCFYEISYQRGR